MNTTDNQQDTKNSRRDFLKKAGKAAVVAPAAGVILNAAQVQAQPTLPSGADICQVLQCDD